MPTPEVQIQLMLKRVRHEFAQCNITTRERDELIHQLERHDDGSMTSDEANRIFVGLRPDLPLLFKDLIPSVAHA